MLLFDAKTAWEQARAEVRHTASALGADDAHQALAPPLIELALQWRQVEAVRLAAEDAEVDANARVRVCRGRLGRAVVALARQLEADAPALRRAFFPEAPGQVTRLSLAPALRRVGKFGVVRAECPVPESVGARLDAVAAAAAQGALALQGRAQAESQTQAARMDVAAWKAQANTARRTADDALAQFATAAGLPRDYPETFFAEPRPHRKRPAPAKHPRG